jgi:hypothetical protein
MAHFRYGSRKIVNFFNFFAKDADAGGRGRMERKGGMHMQYGRKDRKDARGRRVGRQRKD